MSTPQAEVFGFPNPILGVAGFAVVMTTGVVLLAGGVVRRWYWLGLQPGVCFGIGLVHWLMFQSLYRIDALCPYCMIVWAAMIPVFVAVTTHTLRTGLVRAPSAVRRMAGLVGEYGGVTVTVWYLVITGLIAQRFWDYWQTLLA